ncbi:MAG: hypothetical protein UMU75_01600, partial [Halomonas sp.]|nr:hypothetical protein [Halomonas sp.]
MSCHPATPAAATQRSQLSWWESLCERCFTSAAPSVAQALALKDGPTYRELIVDLEAPLAPAFERAVARTLDRDSLTGLIPAETLMPAMMQRFG